MKKRTLNKIIILTVCFIVTSSTLVLAKSITDTSRNSNVYSDGIDPFPMEDTETKK